jgi:pimeloyl-ACP methyl ester carboxylesterase
VEHEDRITFEIGPNDCISDCFQLCKELDYKGQAHRVVGRGLQSDLLSDGTLENPAKFISDGVLDEFATLHLVLDPPVGNPDGWGNERPCQLWIVNSHVRINNVPIAAPLSVKYCPTAGRQEPQHLTVKFPAKLLRFPTRNAGSAPSPRENTLKIQTTASIHDLPGECDDHLGYGIREAYIEFKAMAPVLAIHGCCGESESWFTGTNVDAAGGNPTDDLKYPPPRISEVFSERRAGFRTVNFSFAPDSTQVTIRRGMPHLAGEVSKTLKEFGTQTIHLLAHSKGGLRARHLLGTAQWQNTGIRSLITIATPHYGSTVAEWAKAQQLSGERREYTGQVIGALTGFVERERDELTQAGADAIVNTPFPSPPPEFHINGAAVAPRYWTIGADADRNGNRLLEPSEVANLMPLGSEAAVAGAATLAYRIAGLAEYVYTEKVTEERIICAPLLPTCKAVMVTVHRIREVPHSEPFRPNDVVVTRRSAAYRFTEAKFYDGEAGQNHHSIGNYWFTGNDIYDLLKTVPK